VIKDFTGVSSPYEAPLDPALVIETSRVTVEQGVAAIINYLQDEKKLALASCASINSSEYK